MRSSGRGRQGRDGLVGGVQGSGTPHLGTGAGVAVLAFAQVRDSLTVAGLGETAAVCPGQRYLGGYASPVHTRSAVIAPAWSCTGYRSTEL